MTDDGDGRETFRRERVLDSREDCRRGACVHRRYWYVKH